VKIDPGDCARKVIDIHGANGVAWLDQRAAELGFDRTRMVAWGLAQSILTGWWSLEDHGCGYEPDIVCAEMFEELEK